METSSPLINNLLDFLGEMMPDLPEPNAATVLMQGEAAQRWLLTHYLPKWLELVEALPGCGYPLAMPHRAMLRAIGQQRLDVDTERSASEQALFLTSLALALRALLKQLGGHLKDRSLQWGIWGRDIPMAIAYGFREVAFLDADCCQNIAEVCMLSAFLVSEVVSDDGVAEEISAVMFEEKPRVLVELLREQPVAPEA